MDPIQTALNVSKSEVADQAIGDSISNDLAERSFGDQFKSVPEFESAKAQCTRLISSKVLDTDKSLFQEDAGRTIRIGRVVCRSEAELSLRSGCNGMRRQADQPGHCQLKQPIVGTELPAGGDTKQGGTISVAIISLLRFEEIPILESKPQAAVNGPTRNANDSRQIGRAHV